jgi:hypothetical protein
VDFLTKSMYLKINISIYYVQRLAVGILIAGFVFEEEDFLRPWDGYKDNLERYLFIYLYLLSYSLVQPSPVKLIVIWDYHHQWQCHY